MQETTPVLSSKNMFVGVSFILKLMAGNLKPLETATGRAL